MVTTKRRLTSIGMAIILMGFAGITGCGKKAGEGSSMDSTTTKMDTTSQIKVDSSSSGTTVKATERDFDFDGVVSAVNGDMVTVQHEAISDYKPAGSDSYKLAQADMAQYIKAGDSVEFTIKVNGDQAVITEMQKEESGD